MFDLFVTEDVEKTAADFSKPRQQADYDLWKQWDQGGRQPDDLRPLLQNFRGLLRSRANRWVSSVDVDIPPAAIHAEFNKQFLKAVETYDPNRGAALGTWVDTNLKQANRWMATYRNPVRMSETRFYKVGEFDNAKSILDEQLGREPNTQELAEYLKWSEAEVARLENERRRTLTSSAWESDPSSIAPSPEAEKLNILRYELTPKELLVYEYTIGYGGKPQLKPSQIAQRMGVSPSTVSKLRKSIANKAKKYM